MAYREVTMVEIREVLRQWLEGTGKEVPEGTSPAGASARAAALTRAPRRRR
jgi:hypothetical protein